MLEREPGPVTLVDTDHVRDQPRQIGLAAVALVEELEEPKEPFGEPPVLRRQNRGHLREPAAGPSQNGHSHAMTMLPFRPMYEAATRVRLQGSFWTMPIAGMARPDVQRFTLTSGSLLTEDTLERLGRIDVVD
jgi:hypothetical protein